MNVSPSSNSVTSKATSLLETSGSSAETSESSEGKGFFASLKDALGFGEEVKAQAAKGNESGDAEQVTADSDNTEKSESVADTAKKVVSDGQATDGQTASQSEDALLKSKSADNTSASDDNSVKESNTADANKAAALENGVQKPATQDVIASDKSQASAEASSAVEKSILQPNTAAEPIAENRSQPVQSHRPELTQVDRQTTDASKASAAMSEGNKLLGQLDEANKTLQTSANGKDLPQIGSTPVAMMSNDVPEPQLKQAQLQQLKQQGVTPQQIEPSAKVEQSVVTSASEPVQPSQVLTQAELELVAEVEMHTQAINQLNTQIEATEVVVNELETKQLSGEELSDAEKATLAKASSELVVLQQQRTQLVEQASQLYSQAPAAINWDAPLEASEVATDNPEEWAAATTVAAGASQHRMQQNVAADKAQAVLAQSNNAQSVQMQQVQQAAAQQASSASSGASSAQGLSPDLNLAATHNAATNLMGTEMLAAKAGTKDVMLKAGAGTAALAGLGRATGKEDSKESSFAQQIASAAGVQGTTSVGSAPTRAEIQAAQQAPLQLTKELANEQVAEKVQMMMSKNLKNLDIRLDPPELGQLKIRMTMNNDVANVHFTVTNQQARDVIEQTLPRLREMLAQQGMQLADSSVQQQSTGQGQARYNGGDGVGQSGSGGANDGQGDENLDSNSNLELNVASKRDGISYYA